MADLGTSIITISGGEPLLHPELDEIIRRMRQRGMIAGMITNGYLLTADRIKRLNDAGLDHMQISIDNVMPDDVSKKSLKVLDKKLQLLSEFANFHVNINSVLGGGIHNPNDALTVSKRALELGFTSTVGIIHDHEGQLRPLGETERNIYLSIKKLEKANYSRFNWFQEAIAWGRSNEWRCRAGARYLYICEDGLVHYCSQQRGYPAKPLAEYTRGRYSTRVHHRERLRSVLHGFVRPSGFVSRFLARAADHQRPAAGFGVSKRACAAAIKRYTASQERKPWNALATIERYSCR